jgi:hypothetical protein
MDPKFAFTAFSEVPHDSRLFGLNHCRVAIIYCGFIESCSNMNKESITGSRTNLLGKKDGSQARCLISIPVGRKNNTYRTSLGFVLC